MLIKIFAGCAITVSLAGAALAAPVEDNYAPYEYLIGDWISAPSGSSGPTIRQSFRWGPRRSYIFYSTFTRLPGKPEAVHFEGMMVWSGASRALDFLFVVEPGSGTLERGTTHSEADGTVVRDIALIAPSGASSTFRQTFRPAADGKVVTSLMRQTATGWSPTFAGSDALVMTRQTAG